MRNDNVFDKFIEEFIPAMDLANYLKKKHIKDSDVAQIISYAKAPLERKRDALYFI